MRRLSALVVALLFGIVLTPQSQAASQFGQNRGRASGDRVCLYRDIQYQGMEQCYSIGDSVATLQGFSGRTSSIRMTAAPLLRCGTTPTSAATRRFSVRVFRILVRFA